MDSATYLYDAANAGAEVYARVYVDRVLIDEGGRAVGVAARRADGSALEVRARRGVVLAAGALHSPCVLLRSGVGGPHVGRHLRLHPVIGVVSQHEEAVRLYQGAPMTSVCDEADVSSEGLELRTSRGLMPPPPYLHP